MKSVIKALSITTALAMSCSVMPAFASTPDQGCHEEGLFKMCPHAGSIGDVSVVAPWAKSPRVKISNKSDRAVEYVINPYKQHLSYYGRADNEIHLDTRAITVPAHSEADVAYTAKGLDPSFSYLFVVLNLNTHRATYITFDNDFGTKVQSNGNPVSVPLSRATEEAW